MANNNDPLRKWEDTVQDQAQQDLDKFQNAQEKTNRVLEQTRIENERDQQVQNDNATTYDFDTNNQR